MSRVETPIASLVRVAASSPDRLAFGYPHGDGETLDASLTYGELCRRAEMAAAALLRRAKSGDRVLLAVRPGPAFAIGLFGCWRAGLVPVPAYPPRPNRPNDRALAIARSAGARLAFVADGPQAHTREVLKAGGLECLDLETLREDDAAPHWVDWAPDAVHLIQYTSGSTADPKGVAVTVAALAANLNAANVRMHPPADGVTVSWLPAFHDLGLIQGTIQPIWRGHTAYILTPTEFVKNPLRWLQAMSRYRATESQAPNFAFELVARAVKRSDLAGIDLSSVRHVIVGAEPIRKPVMDEFLALVADTGFRPSALVYGYGMAETTLVASMCMESPLYRAVDAGALERGIVQPAADGMPCRHIASCGPALAGSIAVVVDPDNRHLVASKRVGEIWLAGPSLAQGYWQLPDVTRETFGALTSDGQGPFLRTGDLGFLDERSRIHITGRLKDVIIVNGRNHYPQDIEASARAADPHLSDGRGAAFWIDANGREAIVLVQEVRRDGGLDFDDVVARIRHAVADEDDVELDAVVLVRTGTLPLTSSGKVQRAVTRRAWQDGRLTVVGEWRRSPDLQATQASPAADAAAGGARPDSGLLKRLVSLAAEVSGLPPERIDPTEPLARLGLGSLQATRLIGLVESEFKAAVDPTVTYTHPTLAQLADLIATRARTVADQAVATAFGAVEALGLTKPSPALAEDAIAIVAMACRFPGAEDLASFWQLIVEGRCAIGDPPRSRSDLAASFASISADVPRRGGFLDRVDGFDPAFFKMSPVEAALVDPQHRLFLEVAWTALETLADAPDCWAGRRVGIFVGLGHSDYFSLMARAGRVSAAQALTGTARNMVANRLSYLLDLKGPSVVVDTACSSSLVAVATAVRSIEAGDCDMAIVGGVNLTLDGAVTESLYHAGMLAADGACKSFDETADGYGRGEGCGVVVLKRASDARAAGDRIFGLIAGVAINQDGLSNGLTAPNGRAQEDVIGSALAAAGIGGDDIAYVEAHGSGTQLGDPVEANALAATLGPPRLRRYAGTVKANLGHLEAAAGIAGLIKATLVLDHRVAPPCAGLRRLNPLIASAAKTFDLPLKATPLAVDARFAGVSSFGFGGTNAHVVLRAPDTVPKAEHAPPDGEVALCLSARDAAALKMLAGRWRDTLLAHPDVPASVWAANTLRRRVVMRTRLVVIGENTATLAGRIDRWLAGERSAAVTEADDPALTNIGGVPGDIARAWLGGERPDWRNAWIDAPLPLAPLPSYPFQRERCWIAAATQDNTPAEPVAVRAAPNPVAIEDTVTGILGRLLGLDPAKIDRNEKLIEIGADSIVLARALREIERSFSVTVGFRQILEQTPTIAGLARHLAAMVLPVPEPTPAAAPVSPAGETSVDRLLAETERTLAALTVQQGRLRQLLVPEIKPADAATNVIKIPTPSVVPRNPPTTERRSLDDGSSSKLATLAQRFVPRTAGSKRLTASARDVLADVRAAAGFRQSIKEMLYPIVADRAAGAHMTDVDGNDYVDIAMGFGVLLFGHTPAFVAEALSAEIARGMALGPQNRLAGEVAAMLCRMTSMERAAFTSTGTEAVMTALRLARTATGRRKVVIFDGAYHGHFDGVLGVGTGDGLETRALAPGVTPGAIADLIVLNYAEDRSLQIIRELGDTVAAVLVEPVQSRRPDLQPGAFLAALRETCDRSGAALVFDEMITGFRIAADGAQGHFGVRADIATYGKILGGGLPIGAVAGTRRFLDALDGGSWRYGDDSGPQAETTFFAGTFNKHPLAMAGAHAVLGHLQEKGPALYDRLNAAATDLEARLLPLLAPAGLGISRFGSLFRFSHAGNADGFFYRMLHHGVYLWEGRTCFLSTAHGPADIDRIVDAVEASVGELTERSVVAVREIAAELPAALPAASRQILLLAELAPGAWLAYQEAAAVRLPRGTTAAGVTAALEQLAARYDALRLVIDKDGKSAQLQPAPAVALGRRSVEPGEDLSTILAQARAVPLDRHRPLWRAELIEEADTILLLIVAHHAVIDGLSLGALLGEVAFLAAGAAAGIDAATMDGSAPNSGTAIADDHMSWWQQRLSELPPPPELPLDRPRPALPSFAGASIECAIEPDLWAAIRHRAAAAEATPHMLLAAAWAATLHRVAGVERLTPGVVTSGRRPGRDEARIGNFAQVLPIESRLAPSDDLLGYFRRMRQALLDVYDRQNVVMAEVLEAAARPFDPSRPAAIPLVFNLDTIPPSSVEWVSVPTTHAKFELALNVIHQPASKGTAGATVARLDFSTELFDEATGALWLAGFVALLKALSYTPLRRPAEVWAAPPVAASRQPLPHSALPDWLAATAAVSPNKIAITCRKDRVTYAALAARAGSLAAAIAVAVPGEERVVAIVLAPSIDLPAALWAVHWAGHAYLPLDAQYPVHRLRALLAETGTALILTDEVHRAAVEPLGLPVLVVDHIGAQAPPHPVSLSPDRLAYLLHTSGSTGAPKAIAVSHGALLNLLASMIDAPGISPADSLLALTPLTFDIAALELFLPLVAGATLNIAPAEHRGDGRALARLAEHVRPSIVQATPSVWMLLLEGGWRPPRGLKALVGGEKLPVPLAERLISAGCEAWNMYGPTETTIWSSCGRVTSPSRADLGAPVRGTILTVVDAHLDPVAPGGIGELAIGGAGLARGYWGRPDLTAERFRPDRMGERRYLTGDIVRVGTDGRLYFLGRRDHQVKIAGHRIELDEVSAALERLPGIARAIAVVDGAGAAARLAAQVQPKPGVILRPEVLTAALQDILPPYLVPSRLTVTATLPMTANGKIRRAAIEIVEPVAALAVPATGLERRLAAIWAGVLGVEQVDPARSFFALGGTSLMLAHMHLKVVKETGSDFPLVDCVRFPTIRLLARYLNALARDGDRESTSDLVQAAARGRDRAENLRRLAGFSGGELNA
jgi:iturin family lipopeptide synthetase A